MNLINRKRATLAVTVLAIAAIAAIWTVSAVGSPPLHASGATRVFTANLEKSSYNEVDNKPKGTGIGDTWQGSASIAENGQPAGRVELTTTLVDPKYHVGFQIGTMLLADGTITYQGVGIGKRIPNTQLIVKDNVYAITGGTGAYAGAGGTLTLRSIGNSDSKVTATVEFTP